MQLYQKIVGFIGLLFLLIIIGLFTYFFWPKTVTVNTDISTNEDNEKNTGLIKGSATNSQNQSHYSFGGEFVFSILIFLLLVIQSTMQSIIFFRYIKQTTGRTKKTAHPTSQDSTLSHSPKLSSKHRSKSLSHPPEAQPNTYYTISEIDSPKYAPSNTRSEYGITRTRSEIDSSIALSHSRPSPYTDLRRHVSQLDIKESKLEEEDYRQMYEDLKLRSAAAGLQFKN